MKIDNNRTAAEIMNYGVVKNLVVGTWPCFVVVSCDDTQNDEEVLEAVSTSKATFQNVAV